MYKTFGSDTYQLLLDDMIDYSATDLWSDEGAYILNDLVKYDGLIYKLNVASNTSNDAPDCSTEWSLAPKFNTTCYNNLFESGSDKGGLNKLLAWVIYAKAVPFYPNILGVTDFMGEDEKYKEKIQYLLGGVYSNIQTMYKKLMLWNAKNKCITIYQCDTNAGTETNQAARTTAW